MMRIEENDESITGFGYGNWLGSFASLMAQRGGTMLDEAPAMSVVRNYLLQPRRGGSDDGISGDRDAVDRLFEETEDGPFFPETYVALADESAGSVGHTGYYAGYLAYGEIHTASLVGEAGFGRSAGLDAADRKPAFMLREQSVETAAMIEPELASQNRAAHGTGVQLVAPEEIVPLDATLLAPELTLSGPEINIDAFRSNPDFAGIDGSGFSVVVIDSGIDLDHPFFGPDADGNGVADRIAYQWDFADGDSSAAAAGSAHGTHVTSIATSSDPTYTGMAPGADIIHLKVFQDSGPSYFSYIEDALQWVVDNATAYNVASVSISLSDSQNHSTAQQRYGIDDELSALAALDVITVAAAGNGFYEAGSTEGLAYPASDPNALAAGAAYDGISGGWSYGNGAVAYSTGADRIAPFSQRDDDLTTVFAPGAPITAAGLNGGLATMHGTSMAAPHIAGVAALAQQLALQELGRTLSVAEFTDLLVTSGQTIIDGDDEDDNVTNTGLSFPLVDVLALGNAILALKPSLSLAAVDAVQSEGDTGHTAFTFAVTRSGDVSGATGVDYAVTGSGATPADAQDFVGGALPSGTVSFAAGETAKTIAIAVAGDGTDEPDEPDAGFSGTDSFTYTIADGNGGSATATVTVEVTAQSELVVIDGTDSRDIIDVSGETAPHQISGFGGHDALTGGSGNDILSGGPGLDRLGGGPGDDVFRYAGQVPGDHDRIHGGDGFDTVLGSSGDDVVGLYDDQAVLSVERIDGNGGSDIILGANNRQNLDFSGTELIGISLIDLSGGHDTLIASAGDDVIRGGAGFDVLTGGPGTDTALFAGNFADYDISLSGATTIVTDQGSNGDDSDRLEEIEVLRFADGSLAGGVFTPLVDPGNMPPIALDDSGSEEWFDLLHLGTRGEPIEYASNDAGVSERQQEDLAPAPTHGECIAALVINPPIPFRPDDLFG